MKADLNFDLKSLKTELKRLADIDYLKKELNRLAADIKNFDLSQSLTPQAKVRVEKLEKRFRALKDTLQDLQSKADKTFAKFAALVRRNKETTKKTSQAARGSAKKAPRKTSAKSAGEAKSAKKTSSKSAGTTKKRKSAAV